MAITYVSGGNPYWYFSDLTGKSAGAGQVFFYSSLNPDVLKTVFQDSAGLLAYPNPIDINLNGTVPPIFFAKDSGNTADNYDIFAYDAQGNLIEQINNYSPATGSGGGGTTILNLKNLVVNNVMYRHIDAPITPGAGAVVLAPGAHQGLAATTSNYGPDILLVKSNATSTDAVTFPVFALGLLPMSPSDVTPVDYFSFDCSNQGIGETYKYVQYPLTSKVQNLSNQAISGTIWGICTSGSAGITLNIAQFFGDGSSASAPVITTVASIVLTNTWTQYSFNAATIPSVSGKTLGQCGNDGLFLQVGLPVNNATVIGLTKPTLYQGTAFPANNYSSYDEISSIIDSPRTGDLRIGINNFPYGWVSMNNGSIGNASSNSAAGASPSTRADLDTFPLFNLLWNAVGATYAPMYNSSGVLIAYGASAIADFSANNRIALTQSLGRAIASIGPGFSLGETAGAATETLSANNLPDHVHFAPAGEYLLQNFAGGANVQFTGGNNSGLSTITGGVTNSPLSIPFSIMQPTSFFNLFMKL